MGDSKTKLGLAPTRVQRDDERSLEATIPLADGEQVQTTHAFPEGKVLAERYRITRLLGRGGMAEVYLGEHITIQKQVAIKVAGVAFANETELRQRFLQEARAASVIHHEHIVDITDFGHTPEGVPFFTMEYLEGEDLAATIKREGPFSWERSRAIALQILDALSEAHEKGIVHRDMKPQNCFRLTRKQNPDFIKVVDFGLAKVVSKHLDAIDMTRSGVVMGTAMYMAPEQAMGLDIDGRADLYSVGVMLYEMLVGRPPFHDGGFLGVLHQHINEPVPSLREQVPELSRAVEELVFRALAKRREHRFQSAEVFAAALRETSDSPLDDILPAPPRNRVGWVLSLVAAGVAAAAVTVVVTQYSASTPKTAAQVAAASPGRASDGGAQLESRTSFSQAGGAGMESVPEGGTSTIFPGSATADELSTDVPATTESSEPRPAVTTLAAETDTTINTDVPDTTSEHRLRPASKPNKVVARLSDGDIDRVLRRAEPKVRRSCKGTFPDESVIMTLTIHPSGHVSDVKVVKESLLPKLRRCMEGAVAKIRFPRSHEQRTIKHTFRL